MKSNYFIKNIICQIERIQIFLQVINYSDILFCANIILQSQNIITFEKLGITVYLQKFNGKKNHISKRFYSSKLFNCIRQFDIF